MVSDYRGKGVLIILVVLAAITKSAQIPFSAWLPAAIAAPTPISALVHSSTLVTAGVYLVIRFNELIGVNIYLGYISLLTLFISGVGARYEYDLKKIIALSTLSQLGVMIFSLSIGLWEIAFFHLISHAIFKSLLFLCAGVYIHSFRDTQDVRGLGMNIFRYPVTGSFFVGCSLSICGFPFLAGFYSKDLILEGFFFSPIGGLSSLVLSLGVLFTVVYSIRLVYFIYLKAVKLAPISYEEADNTQIAPIGVLFVVSVVVGSCFAWTYLPPRVEALTIAIKTFILVLSMVSITVV